MKANMKTKAYVFNRASSQRIFITCLGIAISCTNIAPLFSGPPGRKKAAQTPRATSGADLQPVPPPGVPSSQAPTPGQAATPTAPTPMPMETPTAVAPLPTQEPILQEGEIPPAPAPMSMEAPTTDATSPTQGPAAQEEFAPPPPPQMPEAPIARSEGEWSLSPVVAQQAPVPDELAKVKRQIIEFNKTTNENLGLSIRNFFNDKKNTAKIAANAPTTECLTLYINVLKSVIRKQFLTFYNQMLRAKDESSFIINYLQEIPEPPLVFITTTGALDMSKLFDAVPTQDVLTALQNADIAIENIRLSVATLIKHINGLSTPSDIQKDIKMFNQTTDEDRALRLRNFFNDRKNEIIKHAQTTYDLTLFINVLKLVIKKRFFFFYDQMLRCNSEPSILVTLAERMPKTPPALKPLSEKRTPHPPLEPLPLFIKQSDSMKIARLLADVPHQKVLNALKNAGITLDDISLSDAEITKKITALEKELAAPKPVITRAPSPRRKAPTPEPMTHVLPAPSPRPPSPRAQQWEEPKTLTQEIEQKNRINELSIREKSDTISPGEKAELELLRSFNPNYKGLRRSPKPVKPLPDPLSQRDTMLAQIRTQGQGGLHPVMKTEKAEDSIKRIKDEIKKLEKMTNPTDAQTKHLQALQKVLNELESKEASAAALLRESEILKKVREQVEPEEVSEEVSEEDEDWK
jgi:hypothetical protein